MKPIRSRDQRLILTLAAGLMLGCASEAIGAAAAGPLAKARRLNNCVTELLDLSPLDTGGNREWEFRNPRDGWVFVRSTANVQARGKLSILIEPIFPGPSSPEQPLTRSREEGRLVVVHENAGVETQEAMRFLPAGQYKVRLQGGGSVSVPQFVVRAIPELTFCKFQYDPFISPHGPYDWTFLQKRIATNANCIVGSGAAEHLQFIQSWKQQGKRWIVECGVPALDGKQPLTADQAYAYWTQNVAFQDPLLDGVIADEFLGNRPGMKYPEWTEAVRRIRGAAQFRRKFFYPYCTAIFGDPVSAEFLQTVMESGYPFAWEVYLQEQPDEGSARRQLQGSLAAEMRRWRAALTNCAQHMIVCFGYMSLPTTETLNINPQVDFKVWMDMQFQLVATDPAFDGLYGLMEYTCGYADEETVRWAARLYRHYGLEGSTVLLSPSLGFKYGLDHLENPDFADGTRGWLVSPATRGSAEPRSMKGYSWLQGRYPRTPLGDAFLWNRRSAQKANLFSQEIKHLRPGQLYSLKMVTADYQELQQGKSLPQKHAVSIALDGVTVLPGKSFQYPIANNYAHQLGAFNEQNKAWMNYHFRLFRAGGQTAKLAISDWAGAAAPGGPPGQELMFNFIEVQPYFEK